MGKTRDTARIRELNDAFRTTFQGGRVVMTQVVSQLPRQSRQKLVAAVQGFSNFTSNNDPHGEHDFGTIEVDGQKFFWKIDYFDLAMNQHSVDAAKTEATMRVMTIMLAHEY